MPNSRYRRLRWHERVKDFPFTHATALGLLLNAIILVFAIGGSPTGSGMIYWLVFFAILAAGHILVGLQWKGTVVMGYGVELTGHWLALGAWLIDLWILFMLGAYVNMTTPLLFMAAHSIRAIRLGKDMNHIRYIMREKAKQVGDSQ